MGKEGDIYSMIQEIVTEVMSQQVAHPEPAIVTSIDPDTYTVKAQLFYDEGIIVGPLRIVESYAGNGFGVTSMPQIGDEVLVVFQGGRISDGYVVGRLHGPEDVAPPFNNGEWKLTHQSGAIVLLDVDGNVKLTSKDGASATIGSGGDITLKNDKVTATLANGGDVNITNGQGTFDMNASGQFAIKNTAGDDLLNILNDTIQDFITAAPSLALYPSGSMNPTLLTNLTALQLKIAALKQ